MEIVRSKLSPSLRHYKFLSPRVYHKTIFSYYSTSSSSSSSSSNDGPSILLKQILTASNPKFSVVPILDKWVSDGRQIRTLDLQSLVLQLKRSRRFSHALQVSDWMCTKHSYSPSPEDIATHMELMCKIVGLTQVEKYFFSLPGSLRSPVVYSAFLNCYANAKSMKKAEDLMQQMKKLGFTKVVVPYNIMLKMYFQMKKYDKAELMVQEIEEMGFKGDTWTQRIQLTAYSNCGKVKEMEMVLMKMEKNLTNTMKYFDYITAANGYRKAGVVEKSLVMLRRAEHLSSGETKQHVYQRLLTLHAHAKVKEEVFRIWELYKKSCCVHNNGYMAMINSLVELDDLEGAEKVVDEWINSRCFGQKVDFRIINELIGTFSKKADFERSQALISKLRKGFCPTAHRRKWLGIAIGYCVHNRMEDAVKAMKKALASGDRTWKPRRAPLIRYLDHLKMNGRPEELQEFTRLLEDYGYAAQDLLSDHSKDIEGQVDVKDEVEEEDRELDESIIRIANR